MSSIQHQTLQPQHNGYMLETMETIFVLSRLLNNKHYESLTLYLWPVILVHLMSVSPEHVDIKHLGTIKYQILSFSVSFFRRMSTCECFFVLIFVLYSPIVLLFLRAHEGKYFIPWLRLNWNMFGGRALYRFDSSFRHWLPKTCCCRLPLTTERGKKGSTRCKIFFLSIIHFFPGFFFAGFSNALEFVCTLLLTDL